VAIIVYYLYNVVTFLVEFIFISLTARLNKIVMQKQHQPRKSNGLS